MISVVQIKAVKGNIPESRKHILRLLESLPTENTLFILPEMILSGYVWESRDAVLPYTEPADGISFQMFSEFCRKHRCQMIYGFAENDHGELFNSQNYIGATDKPIITYRKTHLYEADTTWALPGNKGYISVQTEYGKIGFGICMDLNFDAFVHYHRSNATDLLVMSMNWLEEGGDVGAYWSFRLLPFNRTAVIANTYGNEDEIRFCGRSSVFNRNRLLQQAPSTGDAIISFTTEQLEL